MSDIEHKKACIAAENDAAREINHIGSTETEYLFVRYVCTCRVKWKSEWRSEEEAARGLWLKHIAEHGAEIKYPEIGKVAA